MDDSAVKETRQVLRRIQDHLFHAHTAFGVEHETVGFVDVIHHPANRVPDLNYVTPRRNTAWVSGSFVQQGLDRLRSFDRVARVQYIEGLFPPQFARTLGDLGLQSEAETRLMAFNPGGLSNWAQHPRPITPRGVRLETVTDRSGTDLWPYVWRNAYYDVMTLGVEPLLVERELAANGHGQEIDIVMQRHNFPVGIVRLGVQTVTQSAHVVALALLREGRTPQMTKVLLLAAMRAALARGCNLVFAPGASTDDRRLCGELGFIDVGGMVCYAARSEKDKETASEAQEHDGLVQPVLALRR